MKSRALAVVAVVGATGCDRIFSLYELEEVPSDAAATGDAADAADAPDGEWQPAQPLPGNPITGTGDDATMTQDRLEIVFNLNGDIYSVRRETVGADWGTPSHLLPPSSASSETTPKLQHDGLTMMFASDRPGTLGGLDLWISTRASLKEPWSEAGSMSDLSSSFEEHGASTSADGLAIVFSSSRGGNVDLYTSRRTAIDKAWSTPRSQVALNSPGGESGAYLSPDGLTVYFASPRDGNLDIYVADRASIDDDFGLPTPLAVASSLDEELDPWVSADGHFLLFNRRDASGAALWYSTR